MHFTRRFGAGRAQELPFMAASRPGISGEHSLTTGVEESRLSVSVPLLRLASLNGGIGLLARGQRVTSTNPDLA
ncbi:MAG: hypothetical protein HC902_09310 [Calothrix sp. SM1_5_4]|nr:hypothetical protein [Calothrix sp. SM1_5_4]